MSKTIKVLGVELKPFDNKEIENYTYKDYEIINEKFASHEKQEVEEL